MPRSSRSRPPRAGTALRVASILPGHPSSFFETNNRGVKSVTLNLKTPEGRELLYKLVARADIFGQNFCPGAAEKNGFGYEDLKKVNPRLVYVSISGYGPRGPNAHLPGTDAMAQALGGVAQAYRAPGQPMRTGIASVADETCAILAFGGALAALTHARATGVGQKVELSLLGSIVRLLGWTFTTTLWRGTDPVTGQIRVAGTHERPAMSACFVDRDGKPLVFQLARDQWKEAMTALGFYEEVEKAGFSHLGVAMDLEEKRAELLALLDRLFATDTRDHWVSKLREADIVSAPINTMLEAACDPDVLANGYVAEVDYPKQGKRLRVHGTPWQFSETLASIGIAPEARPAQRRGPGEPGLQRLDIRGLRERKIIEVLDSLATDTCLGGPASP